MLHTQEPAIQVGVTMVHTLPHMPQLFGSVRMLTSQPSICLLLLQSAKPAAQVPLQKPAVQVTVSMWLGEQTVPHAPQFVTLVEVLTHAPLQAV